MSYTERPTTQFHKTIVRNSYSFQTPPGRPKRGKFENWPGSSLTLKGSLGLITGPNCIWVNIYIYVYIYKYIYTYDGAKGKGESLEFLEMGERGPPYSQNNNTPTTDTPTNTTNTHVKQAVHHKR